MTLPYPKWIVSRHEHPGSEVKKNPSLLKSTLCTGHIWFCTSGISMNTPASFQWIPYLWKGSLNLPLDNYILKKNCCSWKLFITHCIHIFTERTNFWAVKQNERALNNRPHLWIWTFPVCMLDLAEVKNWKMLLVLLHKPTLLLTNNLSGTV